MGWRTSLMKIFGMSSSWLWHLGVSWSATGTSELANMMWATWWALQLTHSHGDLPSQGCRIPLCRACKALCEDGWLIGIDPWRKTGVSSASEKSDWRKSLFSTLAGSSFIIFFMLSSSVRTSCSYMREESDSLNGPGCHQFNGTVQIRKEMLHDGAYPCLWQNCITPAVVQASMKNYLQCNFHLHKHTQEKWFG